MSEFWFHYFNVEEEKDCPKRVKYVYHSINTNTVICHVHKSEASARWTR